MLLCYFLNKKIHEIILKFVLFKNYDYIMKYLISSKRSRAVLGIGLVSISIGLISKKVINYPDGGCMKGTKEITFNFSH